MGCDVKRCCYSSPESPSPGPTPQRPNAGNGALHASSAADGPSSSEYPDGPAPRGWYARFQAAVKSLKHEVLALYYAIHDPRTPWTAKLLPWFALAYALSPLDLIPDFIPVLGFLDDMLLLPALLWIAVKLIPAEVSAARMRMAHAPLRARPSSPRVCRHLSPPNPNLNPPPPDHGGRARQGPQPAAHAAPQLGGRHAGVPDVDRAHPAAGALGVPAVGRRRAAGLRVGRPGGWVEPWMHLWGPGVCGACYMLLSHALVVGPRTTHQVIANQPTNRPSDRNRPPRPPGTGGVCTIVYVTWMVTRLQHERRRRDEWNQSLNASLLPAGEGSA
jgi:uncharacterized membrane protein YkvA (DUF1232 family)